MYILILADLYIFLLTLTFNTFPVYPLSAKPLILLAFCRYRYHTSLFDRPDFQRMMADAQAGLIKTIIVKDMSRFGRDYIMVGYYTEILLPQADIRFIAVNDGVDTDNQADNDFTPFRNIINEWYAKDTSKKIRSVLKAKGNAGKHLSVIPPFGYKKDPNDKEKWIIDEEAAQIVKKIFRMYLDGNTMGGIARKLTEEGIETPKLYAENRGIKHYKAATYPEIWSRISVEYILSNYEYTGRRQNANHLRIRNNGYRVRKIGRYSREHRKRSSTKQPLKQYRKCAERNVRIRSSMKSISFPGFYIVRIAAEK